MALESGKYKPDSEIDTSPGWMVIGGYKIKDEGVNGIINLTQVLQKSSNIGAAKILLSLEPQQFWNLLTRVGFGERSTCGFPGESNGKLVPHSVWYPSEIATLSYGYGIAVTALQLAQAYTIFANDGVKIPLTFLKVAKSPEGLQVLDRQTAHTVLAMLEKVIEQGGTGTRAQIPDYRVAGKTGTAYIADANGYDRKKHVASFIGIAPVSNPEIIVAVIMRDPKGPHTGGATSAPLFAKVMGGALRILDIPPDNLQASNITSPLVD